MKPSSTATLKTAVLVSVGAFVFTFGMVPLYYIACEKVFGIKLEQGPAGETRAYCEARAALAACWASWSWGGPTVEASGPNASW